jgi:D-glycero-alpha-D-manno-heptose 1-phosphate guanylyltransferase
MEAIILAGGKGTRLKSMVSDRPKPLADVNGQPFLSILMSFLICQGCQHFILATGHQREMIRSQYADEYLGIPISYSEETAPLGTGGAFMNARQKLKKDGPFLVLNGDTFFPIDLGMLEKKFTETQSDVTIALFKTNESGRYGAAEQDKRGLIKLTTGRANAGESANGGMFMIEPTKVNLIRNMDLPCSFESDFLPTLAKVGGRITGLTFNEPFSDIGIPQDYLHFCESMRLQKPPESKNIWPEEPTKRRVVV